MTGQAADESSRTAIRDRLDANLYVEAGAGTGKTTSLVDRVVTLLTTGRASIDEIVAITFTRAAASELKTRIRQQLETFADKASPSVRRDRATRALEGIDNAAFQTIDSFALSLLRERPLEAGLPPVITPRDEIEAQIQFAAQWRRWLDAELSADDGRLLDAVGRAMRLGLGDPLGALRVIADAFHQNYDLLDGEDFSPPTPAPSHWIASLDADCTRISTLAEYCADPADRLFNHVETVVKPWVGRIRNADRGGAEIDYLLAECPKLSTHVGRRENWPATGAIVDAKRQILETLAAMQESVDTERRRAAASALSGLLLAARRMVLDYASRRRGDGTLEFHDMLVMARELLAGDEASRRHFKRRYPVVLVDEFQDTDPVQLDLLTLLTRADLGVPGGSLFLVGDPKQSIYRFRRADVTASDEMRGLAKDRGDWLPLQANHRSQEPIIAWVNHVFNDWLERQRRQYGPLQADYIPLTHAATPGVGDVPVGSQRPAVRWFGAALGVGAPEARLAESRDVAGIATEAGGGAFVVRDQRTGELRPSRFGDVCVLLRTRTGLDQLEQALSDAGVPFTLEGQSLVFGTQEFRDLENALTAVDDPTDQVSVVSALRSPVFACSDEDIWLWASHGGSFDYSIASPGSASSASPAIQSAFESLRSLHLRRMAASFPVIVEQLVRERRLIESAHLGPQGAERVRRIDLFLDQAKELRDAGVTSLRGFVAWLGQRREGRARAPETVMSESSADSVRVMTIHAAKGLEFPIVVIAGNASAGGGGARQRVVFNSRAGRGHRVQARIGRQDLRFETDGFREALEDETKAEEAEIARLMYVAATRSRDHLFVSLHRKASKSDTTPAAVFDAICVGAPGVWERYEPVGVATGPVVQARVAAGDLSLDARARWHESHVASLIAARSRGYVTATELKSRAEIQPAAKEQSPEWLDEPWRRGRGALALGRAVHAVLQFAALDGSDVGRLAEEQALAHDLGIENSATVAELARETLECPSVAAARGRRTWRELWVAAPLADGLSGDNPDVPTVEGAIDLIYEDAGGSLVIVDYKTDRVAGSTLEAKARPYVLQLGAYAWAVEKLTGRLVSKAVLVFSTEAAEGRPAEYEIPDLRSAMTAARSAASLAAGVPAVR